MKLKLIIFILFIIQCLLTGCEREDQTAINNEPAAYSEMVKISEDVLLDKIKGGWVGQVIGCTYGGPTEFKFWTIISKSPHSRQNI